MAGHRDYDSLSHNYRDRLAKHGVGRSEYESGASLATARGHAKGRTPEHARDVIKNPERYVGSGYRPRKEITESLGTRDRERLETTYVVNVTAKLGDRVNDLAIQDQAAHASIEQLITGLAASESELRELARAQTPNDKTGKFYQVTRKGKTTHVNPFWYK